MSELDSVSQQDNFMLSIYIDIFDKVRKSNELNGSVSNIRLTDTLIKFEKDLYKYGFIQSFDYTQWVGVEEYVKNTESLKHLDLITLQKLLTYHVRVNRFCEGHLIDMIYSGHINGILKHLKELINKV